VGAVEKVPAFESAIANDDPFESAGPRDIADAALDGISIRALQRDVRSMRQPDRSYGQSGILLLVHPFESRFHVEPPSLGTHDAKPVTASRGRELMSQPPERPCTDRVHAGLDHRRGFRAQPAHHDRSGRFDDPRLLRGDRLQGVAEDFRVVEADGRDDRGEGMSDHVRRVQSTAEADLEHGSPNSRVSKCEERDQRRHLEEGEIEMTSHRVVQQANDARVVDHFAIDLDALVVPMEVRTAVETRGDSSRPPYRSNRSGNTPFPVRADDVHDVEPVLRVALDSARLDHRLEIVHACALRRACVEAGQASEAHQ